MENLTHALTGWTLARAGLDRQVPAGGALLILAANVPDVDVLAAIRGSAAYLDHHRGITHSLAASPAMAAICVLPFALWRRGGFPWLRAWLGAWAAVLSHLAWDWTNIYGIRLFEPFSSAWLRADWVSVLDPAVWLILIAGSFWPFLSRLVSQEIGARPRDGRGAAVAILVLLCVYVGARGVLHARAIETIESRIYEEGPPTRVAALPDLLNPFRWQAIIEHPNAVRLTRVMLHQEFDPTSGRLYYRGQGQHTVARIAARTEPFQVFQRFSAFPYWTVSSTHYGDWGGFIVEVCDLRFGQPGEGRFTARALLDHRHELVESGFQFSPKGQLPRPR